MVTAETIAGDWYKLFYDYLILSHYILLRQARKDRDFQLSTGSGLHVLSRINIASISHNIPLSYHRLAFLRISAVS